MTDVAEAGTAGASGTSTSGSASDAAHALGAVSDGTAGTLAAHKPWFVEPKDGDVRTTTDAAGDATASADAAADGAGDGASKGAAPADAGDVACDAASKGAAPASTGDATYDAAAHAVAAQAMVNYLVNECYWHTDDTMLDQLLGVVRASDKVPKSLRLQALQAVERHPLKTLSTACKCVDALLEVAQKAVEDLSVGNGEVSLSREALSILKTLLGSRNLFSTYRGGAIVATALKVLTEIVPKVTYEHKTAVEACLLLYALLKEGYCTEASALEALAIVSSAFVRGIHDDVRSAVDMKNATENGHAEFYCVSKAIRALQVLAAASVSSVPDCTFGRTLVEAGALDAALSILGSRLFDTHVDIACCTAETIAFLVSAADADKLLDVVRQHPDITDLFVEHALIYSPGFWADGLAVAGRTRFRTLASQKGVFTLTTRAYSPLGFSTHRAYVACKKASDKLAEMARSDADQAEQAKAKQAEAERAEAEQAKAKQAEAEQAKAKQAEAAYAQLKTAYDVMRTERDELRAERIACKAVLTQLQQTMQLLAASTQ